MPRSFANHILVILLLGTGLAGCGANGPFSLVNIEMARVYVRLGEAYEYGLLISQDHAKAAQYYEKACSWSGASQWGSSGCARLAKFYDYGWGVPVDKAKAAKLHEGACKAGVPKSCYLLGLKYQIAHGVALDMVKSTEFFQKACDERIADACNKLAEVYSNGEGVPEDDAKAARLYQLACEGFVSAMNKPEHSIETLEKMQYEMIESRFGGSNDACVNLASMYETGQGVALDKSRAAELFQRGCDQDLVEGCFGLAKLYAEGLDNGQGEGEVLRLLTKACDKQHSGACLQLGMKHYFGDQVSVDKKKSASLFKAACDRSFGSTACNNLGVQRAMGEGGTVDKVEAARLYAGACDAFELWAKADARARSKLDEEGSATSCYNLSLLYVGGEGGLAVDQTKAEALRELACTGAETCEGSYCPVFCAEGWEPGQEHQLEARSP